MSAYRKLLQHIQAKDANGDLRLILVYQSFDEVDMPHGNTPIYFETADHQEVNWLNPQQFEIEATGEILNRVPLRPNETTRSTCTPSYRTDNSAAFKN
jgi:hypothetical protein